MGIREGKVTELLSNGDNRIVIPTPKQLISARSGAKSSIIKNKIFLNKEVPQSVSNFRYE